MYCRLIKCLFWSLILPSNCYCSYSIAWKFNCNHEKKPERFYVCGIRDCQLVWQFRFELLLVRAAIIIKFWFRELRINGDDEFRADS